MEIIRLTNLEDKILCTFGWLMMTAMYGILGAEIGYTSKLPIVDGSDLSVVLVAFVCAFLSTVLFVMWTKECAREED